MNVWELILTPSKKNRYLRASVLVPTCSCTSSKLPFTHSLFMWNYNVKTSWNITLKCLSAYMSQIFIGDTCIHLFIIFFLSFKYVWMFERRRLFSRLERSPGMQIVGCSNPSCDRHKSQKTGRDSPNAKRSATNVSVKGPQRWLL